MAAAFTPGPMLAEKLPTAMVNVPCNATHQVIAANEEKTDVGTVALLGGDCAEGNAHLFAASSDLLRELQHAVRWFDQITPADVARYKAAIAKATPGVRRG